MLPWLLGFCSDFQWRGIGILQSLRPKFLLDLLACRHGATAAFTEAGPALRSVSRLLIVHKFSGDNPKCEISPQDSVHICHAVENQH
ncbi:hypothetical protein NQZ68_004245 [Dissostichus eleginoides]|nr:hypothetical protein NQZ68_004245 [Dissostichus eleginoides]